MMEFTILDSQSTNIVRLGDDRTRVREALGPHRVFRRGKSVFETDHFLESGPMVTYADDRVIMLELVEPSFVSLQGVQLLGETLDALEPRLADVGLHLDRDDMGGVIPEYEVGLYVPYDIVEGVQLGNTQHLDARKSPPSTSGRPSRLKTDQHGRRPRGRSSTPAARS